MACSSAGDCYIVADDMGSSNNTHIYYSPDGGENWAATPFPYSNMINPDIAVGTNGVLYIAFQYSIDYKLYVIATIPGAPGLPSVKDVTLGAARNPRIVTDEDDNIYVTYISGTGSVQVARLDKNLHPLTPAIVYLGHSHNANEKPDIAYGGKWQYGTWQA